MTAGVGTGKRPCCVLTCPDPRGRGEIVQLQCENLSINQAALIISIIESQAPTSWKVISSIGMPWTFDSAPANREKISIACLDVFVGRLAVLIRERISCQYVEECSLLSLVLHFVINLEPFSVWSRCGTIEKLMPSGSWADFNILSSSVASCGHIFRMTLLQ